MRYLVITSLLLLIVVSSQAVAGEVTSPKNIVLNMIEAVNQRNFDALDDLIAPNVKRHCAATPDVFVENLEQFKAFLRQDLAAVPDATQTVNIIFASDDMVAVHVTYQGTQTGQMGPFPPSGKSLTLPFIGLLRVKDGKIAEIWVEWDNLCALKQLGHFPPPAKEAVISE